MEDPRDHRPYARAGLDGRLGRRHLPRTGTGRGDDGACASRCDDRLGCPSCGSVAQLKDWVTVVLVDLPVYGRPTRLAWRKRRMECADADCATKSWTEEDDRIASPRQLLTTRAARWATIQVGRHARSVSEVAGELGCAWHTVNATVVAYGEALLEADVERFGP